jgi:hypothetical protein
VKSRRIRWAAHVDGMGEIRISYRIMMEKCLEKRPLAISRRRWEANIKMDVTEIDYEDWRWV